MKLYIPFLSLSAISFILGIIFSFYIKINFIIFYFLALCVLILLIFSKKKILDELLIILLFFLVGILHQANFNTPKFDDISYLTEAQNEAMPRLNRVSLSGFVASPIQESTFGKSFVFYPNIIRVGYFSSKISGKVYARFYKNINFEAGDFLTIKGKLTAIKNNNYFNNKLIRQGIKTVLVIGKKDWIDITEKKAKRFGIKRFAFQIKEKLKSRFTNISSPAREFLIAFILGDRADFSKELYSVFRYTGTVHILSVSGLHIAIIIFILLIFLKILCLKQKARFIASILFLVFYSFITGLQPPVVRSVIMGVIFMLSFLAAREYHIYNSLALAAIAILLIWPWHIFDVGFQLSFISVLGIVFINPKITKILPKFKNRLINFVKTSFTVSISATLGTAALAMYYFGIFSLVSVIANLFVVILMPFILAGGFVYLFVSLFFPFLERWFALSLEFLVGVLIFIASLFSNIPFAYFYTSQFPLYFLLIYYALILGLFMLIRP